ncbi:MAG: trigger factor [Saprospiraceae bacterium]
MIINPVEKSKYLLQLDVVLEASEINNLFKKELNKTAKTSKMKGFRPGKTPTNLVKNLYGTQMMVELVNKNLVSQVYEYLDKEGIKTFSNFVFDTEDFNYKFTPNDIQDFSASLLVVKEPAVELDSIDWKGNLQYYLPEAQPEKLNEQIDSIRMDIGGLQESEEAIGADSSITVSIIEQEEGADKSEGLTSTFSYVVNAIANETLRESIIGQSKGHSFDLNIMDLTDNEYTLEKQVLKLEGDAKIDSVGKEYKATIDKVEKKFLAEIDEDFFTKIDPNGTVKTVEDLTKILTENYYNTYRNNSDVLFFNDFKDFLLAQFDLDLDDNYYKKFFKQIAGMDDHSLEFHLDRYKDDYKWSWVKGYLDEEYGIEVKDEEITRALIAEINSYFGGVNLPEHMYKKFLDDAYKNPKMVERKKDQIYMSHLVDFMKQNNEIEETFITIADYEAKVEALNDKLVKKAEEENNHDHGHHEHNEAHEHNHGHDLVEDGGDDEDPLLSEETVK